MIDTKEARERIEYDRTCSGRSKEKEEIARLALFLADEVDMLRAAANFERAECGAESGTPADKPVMVIDADSRLVLKIETPPGYRFRRNGGAAIKVGDRVEEGEPLTFSGVTPSYLLAGSVIVTGKVM